MNLEEKNRVLAAVGRRDEQNMLSGITNINGQSYSFYFLFDRSGILVIRLIYGTPDQVDQCYLVPWREMRDFRMKGGLLTNRMTFTWKGKAYTYMVSKSVVGNPWVKENMKHLQSVNFYYSDEASEAEAAANEQDAADEEHVGAEKIIEKIVKPECDPAVTLAGMRALYRENPLTDKTLHKPLWLGKKDRLIQIFQDAELLFTEGEIFYGCLVQANSRLFEKKDNRDYPATIIYSEDPYFEKNPQALCEIAQTLGDAKDSGSENLTGPLRDIVQILNAETDRSVVDFSAQIGEEGHNIRLCSILVFREDLPDGCLKGSLYPILALHARSNAAMILPKEYWTDSFYSLFAAL